MTVKLDKHTEEAMTAQIVDLLMTQVSILIRAYRLDAFEIGTSALQSFNRQLYAHIPEKAIKTYDVDCPGELRPVYYSRSGSGPKKQHKSLVEALNSGATAIFINDRCVAFRDTVNGELHA